MYAIRNIGMKVQQYIRTYIRCHSKAVICPQMLSTNEFSFDSYDVIGFDLDHTICKYRLKPLFELIYNTLASFLVEKYHYPSTLMQVTPDEMAFAQKGLILDKARGNFLKLNCDYVITKATHGTHLLTREEISNIYGADCIWKESKGIPDLLCCDKSLFQPFYVFKDYFVTVGAVVCAKIVDILDKQNNGPLTTYRFWDHFLDGLFFMYDRNNFKNNDGKFFPSLKENPHLYLEPCSERVKNWLRAIGKQKTFLLTSSNVDSAVFLARFCLGDEWTNYFNVIVTFACKPGFFRKNRPFYEIENDIEVCEIHPSDMKPHVIYSQGNWKGLQKLFSDMCAIKNPKTLYVGDSIVEDIYAASKLAHCDTVAVVEEILAEGIKSSLLSTELLPSNFWGSFFCCDENSNEKRSSLSLWAYILSQYSKLSIPGLDVLSELSFEEKISAFCNDHPTAGYFPAMPKILNNVCL